MTYNSIRGCYARIRRRAKTLKAEAESVEQGRSISRDNSNRSLSVVNNPGIKPRAKAQDERVIVVTGSLEGRVPDGRVGKDGILSRRARSIDWNSDGTSSILNARDTAKVAERVGVRSDVNRTIVNEEDEQCDA